MAVAGLALAACGNDTVDVGAVDTTTSAGDTTTTTIATTTTPSGPGPEPTTSSLPPRTVRCSTVGFTPNSEDAASDIDATGVSCNEARAFVGVAGRQTSSGGPAEVDVQGYHCVRTRTVEEPLPQAFYECTKGGTRITFVRT